MSDTPPLCLHCGFSLMSTTDTFGWTVFAHRITGSRYCVGRLTTATAKPLFPPSHYRKDLTTVKLTIDITEADLIAIRARATLTPDVGDRLLRSVADGVPAPDFDAMRRAALVDKMGTVPTPPARGWPTIDLRRAEVRVIRDRQRHAARRYAETLPLADAATTLLPWARQSLSGTQVLGGIEAIDTSLQTELSLALRTLEESRSQAFALIDGISRQAAETPDTDDRRRLLDLVELLGDVQRDATAAMSRDQAPVGVALTDAAAGEEASVRLA